MIRACVIGWPISHSRSPLIHSYWLKQFAIDGTYTREAVAPSDLIAFLNRLRAGEFAGCNVTIPHKEQIAPHLDEIAPQAQRTGSVNTIYTRHGCLIGTSTDGAGFAENIRQSVPSFDWTGKRVLLLGAGGSARAISDELLRRNVSRLAVWNRTEAKAIELARHFGTPVEPVSLADLARFAASTDVLINTTAAGMAGAPSLAFPFASLPSHCLVTDIVYVPLETAFLLEARQHGFATVTGLGMLLHQAVEGFELWFGRRPKVTPELYDLIARDIEGPHRS